MTQATIKKKPSTTSKPTRYEDDVYTWSLEQIELLKAGRLDEVDAANIAWELEDVPGNIRDKLESAIAVLAMHILKWDHQLERRSRSWALTVREQRRRIDRLLKKNPGLNGELSESVTHGYANGRDRALAQTDLPELEVPEKNPYSFKEIMTRDIKF